MTDRERDPLLREHLERLPRDVPPERDLWPAVARRIEAAQRRARVVRAFTAAGALAAAAAVTLVVGLHARSTRSLVAGGSPSVSSPVPMPVAAAPAPPLPGEADYEGAARALAAELDARRAALEPAQAAILDDDLRVVDDAIASTRTAVREHPDDSELRAELDRVWEDKLDLMRQVTDLTSEL
jgi:hypothetical protein